MVNAKQGVERIRMNLVADGLSAPALAPDLVRYEDVLAGSDWIALDPGSAVHVPPPPAMYCHELAAWEHGISTVDLAGFGQSVGLIRQDHLAAADLFDWPPELAAWVNRQEALLEPALRRSGGGSDSDQTAPVGWIRLARRPVSRVGELVHRAFIGLAGVQQGRDISSIWGVNRHAEAVNLTAQLLNSGLRAFYPQVRLEDADRAAAPSVFHVALLQLFVDVVVEQIPVRECPECDKRFTRHRGRSQRFNRRTSVIYCSVTCLNRATQRTYRDKHSARGKG